MRPFVLVRGLSPAVEAGVSARVQNLGRLAATLLLLLLSSPAVADDGMASAFRSALEGGSTGNALLLSFLAGVATSLTPCVYPMIAITVSVFGANRARSRWQGAGLSAAFVLGIVAIFFNLPTLSLVVSGMFLIVSGGLMLYQTSQIVRGGETNYILATITLYVSIYNMFLSLLHLLGAASDD